MLARVPVALLRWGCLMREDREYITLLIAGLGGSERCKKAAGIFAALLVCLVALNLVKSFIQPASALGAGIGFPLVGNLYGDDTAYYCARYGVHDSSVAVLCQAPAMAEDSAASSQSYTAAAGLGCRTYDAIFRQYSWNASLAEAICQAESGGNPQAVSSTNDYGLMQLHNMAIFDPYQNIAAAYRRYQEQGWGAWTSYRTGAYERFTRI
jgi:soluble lytic murein transglycosylase-like protein